MRYCSPVFLTTFFFVSGYLFKSGCTFSKVFEQRTRTLLWPLLALGGIMIVMQHLVTFKAAPLSWSEGFKGLLFQNGENTILWFVAAIYIYSLIFYWVERFSGKWLWLICFVLFVVNWLYSAFVGYSLPWHVSSAGYGCAYMGLGKVYKLNEEKVVGRIRTSYIICALVVYVTTISLLNHSCSFTGSPQLWDSILLTLIGLFLVVELSKRTPFVKSKFLLFVGANTLFYFAFHGKGYAFLEAMVAKMDVVTTPEVATFTGFIIMFLDALLLVIPALIVNRYFPWLLGKGFKLWKAK